MADISEKHRIAVGRQALERDQDSRLRLFDLATERRVCVRTKGSAASGQRLEERGLVPQVARLPIPSFCWTTACQTIRFYCA
jgi:hypothetical protein